MATIEAATGFPRQIDTILDTITPTLTRTPEIPETPGTLETTPVDPLTIQIRAIILGRDQDPDRDRDHHIEHLEARREEEQMSHIRLITPETLVRTESITRTTDDTTDSTNHPPSVREPILQVVVVVAVAVDLLSDIVLETNFVQII